jgi:Amt family ammonium transporter
MTLDTLKSGLDTVWVIIAGGLVFWMCAGFALVETGFCRKRHAVHVLAMNYGVVAVSSLGFWAIGFGLMFATGNGFLGLGGFFPALQDATAFSSLSWATIPIAAKFFFQMVFADTSATIVSGAVAERMKFVAYMLFSFFMVTVLYPITGHWAWGGGFLSTLSVPFQDFAGSTVVHSVGGWGALTGAIFVGARIGKYDRNGKARNIRGHDMAIATLGTLILWLGWIGFNGGSTLAADGNAIAHIITTTILAGCAGLLAAMLASWLHTKKPDLGMMLNGTLAGLVAITAGCNAVSVRGAILIGLTAGILAYCGVFFFDAVKIDDPVGALSVHLLNGIWGTLAVGLFATKAGSVGSLDGLLYGGGTGLLFSQIIGVLSVGTFTFVGSSICWKAIDLLVGLRVPMAVELEGLDMAEHGILAYPEDEEFGETNHVLSPDFVPAPVHIKH